MTAQIYNIRDFQNPKDIERLRKAQEQDLQAEAARIMNTVSLDAAIPNYPVFYAPENDPA